MELNFASGTSEQKDLYQRALTYLRHLPLDALPLSIEVSFVPPDEVGQTSFAETTFEYGSTESTTKVRNDAPGFSDIDAQLIAEAAQEGLEWNARTHFNETAAHELGHSVFAALPEEVRLAIVALFGLDTDDIDTLAPPGSDWHDRPIEGIAETFKEAFLSARHRVFPNRSNVKISYSKFPTFRRLIREAVPQMESTGELPPGETEVPGYNLDLFTQGTPILGGSFANPLPGSGGKHGLWDSSYFERENLGPPFNTVNAGQLQHAAEWQGWVREGTVITYSVTIPLGAFDPSIIGSPEKVSEPYIGDPYVDVGYLWRFLYRPSAGGEYIEDFAGYWMKTLKSAEEVAELAEFFPAEQPAGGWLLTFDAVGMGVAPVTISKSLTVAAPTFTDVRVCKGHNYRLVTLQPQIAGFINRELPPTEANHLALRAAATYPWVPQLLFSQATCHGGSGEVGQPIVIPAAEASSAGSSTGARPHPRPVSGQ
jgi:hypothetical protein